MPQTIYLPPEVCKICNGAIDAICCVCGRLFCSSCPHTNSGSEPLTIRRKQSAVWGGRGGGRSQGAALDVSLHVASVVQQNSGRSCCRRSLGRCLRILRRQHMNATSGIKRSCSSADRLLVVRVGAVASKRLKIIVNKRRLLRIRMRGATGHSTRGKRGTKLLVREIKMVTCALDNSIWPRITYMMLGWGADIRVATDLRSIEVLKR